jgi:hypothetical protein
MRIVSLLLAICFSMNVMASTGTIQELERHIDDYHYMMSVEWDQKDNEFYERETNLFFLKLKTMIKEEGLTQEQIMTLAEIKVNNKAVIDTLKLKLSLLSNVSSDDELAKILKETSKDFYNQGASWNGQVIVSVAVGLVIVGLIGYAIWWDKNHVCVAYENQYVCNTYNNCHYNPHYGGQYCYPNSYTTCGYVDVCTKYDRK